MFLPKNSGLIEHGTRFRMRMATKTPGARNIICHQWNLLLYVSLYIVVS